MKLKFSLKSFLLLFCFSIVGVSFQPKAPLVNRVAIEGDIPANLKQEEVDSLWSFIKALTHLPRDARSPEICFAPMDVSRDSSSCAKKILHLYENLPNDNFLKKRNYGNKVQTLPEAIQRRETYHYLNGVSIGQIDPIAGCDFKLLNPYRGPGIQEPSSAKGYSYYLIGHAMLHHAFVLLGYTEAKGDVPSEEVHHALFSSTGVEEKVRAYIRNKKLANFNMPSMGSIERIGSTIWSVPDCENKK